MAVDIGLDESGNDKVVLVGIQMGTVQRARKLKTKWRAILEKVNLPYFHAIDFENYSSGVFKDLNRNERAKLLDSLASLIRTKMGAGLTFKMTVALWNSKTDNDIRSVYGTAYTILCESIMLGASIFIERQQLGKDINIVIEDGHRNSEQVLQHLQYVKKVGHERFNIVNVGLGSKKDYPILQAADMLAYSEWQKIIGVNSDIYDALHVGGSRYETDYFDCDKELVEVSATGIHRRIREQKEWGRRGTRNVE